MSICFFFFYNFQSTKQTWTFYRTIQWTFLPCLVLTDPVVSEEKIKNRQHHFWHLWASYFFRLILINNKNHKLFIEPSNEHSCQFWLQMTLWIQRRRLKTVTTIFLTCLGLLFLLFTSDQQKKKLSMEPSNEHSYQICF